MAAITIYTTPSCGYCHSAKRLLIARGHAFTEVDVGADPALRQRVSRASGGYRTVPMIFIGDRFIGGYRELAGLDHTGELHRLLA